MTKICSKKDCDQPAVYRITPAREESLANDWLSCKEHLWWAIRTYRHAHGQENYPYALPIEAEEDG